MELPLPGLLTCSFLKKLRQKCHFLPTYWNLSIGTWNAKYQVPP